VLSRLLEKSQKEMVDLKNVALKKVEEKKEEPSKPQVP
jgi:hypothetical protein